MHPIDFSQRLQKAIDRIKQDQFNVTSTDKLRCLVYGDKGVGKTHLLRTCPQPVLVDSFDPNGLVTVRDLIQQGSVIPQYYETAGWDQPGDYPRWKRNFLQLFNEKVFEDIGTYCIDSITGMADALLFAICSAKGFQGRFPTSDSKAVGITQTDYQVQQLELISQLKRILSLPCHVIVTGHIHREKDQLMGGIETQLLLAGKLSYKVPTAFTEMYVLRTVNTSQGLTRELLTQDEGTWRASTRYGGMGKFLPKEKPDINELIRKAGLS